MDGVGSESEWKTVYARYKVNPWDVIFFFLGFLLFCLLVWRECEDYHWKQSNCQVF